MLGWGGEAAAPGYVVEAEDVGWDEQELDGPVTHEDPPPEVEGEVSVVSQEVGVGQGAVLHQDGQAGGGQRHLGRGGGLAAGRELTLAGWVLRKAGNWVRWGRAQGRERARWKREK